MKNLLDFTVGLVVCVAIGYGVYNFAFKGSASISNFDMTLSAFKSMKRPARHALITDIIKKNNQPETETQNFIDCMGDYTANKSETLIFKAVFEWCETEYKNNKERFINHFNQLDAENLSSAAVVICRNFIGANLTRPATAEHPWLDQAIQDHGEWNYTIKSYVDAENTYGAEIRIKYNCEVKYSGNGTTLDPKNWKLVDLITF